MSRMLSSRPQTVTVTPSPSGAASKAATAAVVVWLRSARRG